MVLAFQPFVIANPSLEDNAAAWCWLEFLTDNADKDTIDIETLPWKLAQGSTLYGWCEKNKPDEIVAAVLAIPIDNISVLSTLVVRKQDRGTGVADAFIAWVLSQAKGPWAAYVPEGLKLRALQNGTVRKHTEIRIFPGCKLQAEDDDDKNTENGEPVLPSSLRKYTSIQRLTPELWDEYRQYVSKSDKAPEYLPICTDGLLLASIRDETGSLCFATVFAHPHKNQTGPITILTTIGGDKLLNAFFRGVSEIIDGRDLRLAVSLAYVAENPAADIYRQLTTLQRTLHFIVSDNVPQDVRVFFAL